MRFEVSQLPTLRRYFIKFICKAKQAGSVVGSLALRHWLNICLAHPGGGSNDRSCFGGFGHTGTWAQAYRNSGKLSETASFKIVDFLLIRRRLYRLCSNLILISLRKSLGIRSFQSLILRLLTQSPQIEPATE